MQTPSLGRVVIYTDRFGKEHAAIITFVHNPTVVDLHIYDSYGSTARQFIEQASAQNGLHRWQWPARS